MGVSTPVLYTYWRSTAAWRVRIALALKGVEHKSVPVHLVRDGGEQHKPDFRDLNPQGLLPLWVDEAGPLNQSLAIIEYLEDKYPWPPLLPLQPRARAQVRALALTVACDIHPLNNLRVLNYLRTTLEVSEADKSAWYGEWIERGFTALEKILAESDDTGLCCFGDEPTLADVCLIPQIYNAERFNCPLDAYPVIRRIQAHCSTLPAFSAAHPDAQPDKH